MRIYIFTEHYPSPFKPYFDTQFEQFIKDGHELRVFAFDRHHGDLEPKVVALGLDRATRYLPSTMRTLPGFLPGAAARLLGKPRRSLAALRRIAGSASNTKQGLLQAVRALQLPDEAPHLCLVHNLLTQRHLVFLRDLYPGVPVAFYYHGGEVAGVPTLNDAQASAAFAAADVVFTNTESSKAHAVSRGCDPAKVMVNPVGFNIDEFRPRPNRGYRVDGNLQLLTIGRMSREKGFVYALQAVKSLHDGGIRDFRLRMIGGGPLEGELRSFVREHGLEAQVEFLGQVSRERLYQELEQADVLLLPSIVVGTWQENQACVVQEAMLMRTLVATSTAGGVPESIAPEMKPYSFPPEDAAAVAGSLRALLELKPEEMAALGAQCRRFAETKYDIRMLNQRLLELARPVLKSVA